MTDQTKKCCHCKKEYPIDEFYKSYASECKACCRTRAAAIYRKNKQIAVEKREIDNKMCSMFLRSHALWPTRWEMTLC